MTRCITLRPILEEEWTRFRVAEEDAFFGSLRTPQGYLPLSEMRLLGRITGLAFRLRLIQRFVNNYAASLEATYIFPLPARAAVTHFIMRTRDNEVHGELRERGQAREIYDQAVAQGYQAAITEEERPEVFTMRVGNIPPGEQIEVELELSGPLTMADHMATFRFPLVVAPRYMPGHGLGGDNVGDGVSWDTDATPDASRISPPVLLPGYPNPVRLAIELELDGAGLDYDTVYSSLDNLYLTPSPGGLQTVSLSPQTGQLNRDLILRFPVVQREVRSSLAVFEDPEEGVATWALTLLPSGGMDSPMPPRNLVVLLDRSGSMDGWKMVAARQAVARIVDCFTDGDRFALLAFDNQVEELVVDGGTSSPRNVLSPASDANRFRARQALSRVEARGGTELTAAMVTALERLGRLGEGERFLVVVTDGQVGNEDQTLREVERRSHGVRIFTVGIDKAVNASLLQRLAQFSGGHCELVESEERLDHAMHYIQQRMGHPILTDLQVGLPPLDLTPVRADLYPGLPVRIYGRCQGAVPPAVSVQGRDRQGHLWHMQVPAHRTHDPIVRSLWARERLLELEYGFITKKAGREYTPEGITRFSLAYNVLSRFTAFVAVDRSRQVQSGGPRHQVVQAVDSPAGWKEKTALGGAPRGGAQPKAQAVFGSLRSRSTEDYKSVQREVCQESAPRPSAPPPAAAPLSEAPAQGWFAPQRSESRRQAPPPPPPPPPPTLAKKKDKALGKGEVDIEKLLARLEALVNGGQACGDEAQRVFEELLEALSQTATPHELLKKGYQVLDNLRTGHPGAAARLGAWLSEVRQELAARPSSGREGWWKR